MSGKVYLKNRLPAILVNLLGMTALALFLMAGRDGLSGYRFDIDRVAAGVGRISHGQLCGAEAVSGSSAGDDAESEGALPDPGDGGTSVG